MTWWGKMAFIFRISILHLTKITSNGNQQRTKKFFCWPVLLMGNFEQLRAIANFWKSWPWKVIKPYDFYVNYQKLELSQYNTCRAITGTISVTSADRINQELGLESTQLRRWFRKLFSFYKVYKNNKTSYLSNKVLQRNFPFNTRNLEVVPLFKHNFF